MAAILLGAVGWDRERLETLLFHLMANSVAASPLLPVSARRVVYRMIGLSVGEAFIASGVILLNRQIEVCSGARIEKGVKIRGLAPVRVEPGAVIGRGVTIDTALAGVGDLISAPIIIAAGQFVPPNTRIHGVPPA